MISMYEGYIRICRRTLEDKLYFSDTFSKWQAWCDLIMIAHIEDGELLVRGVRMGAKRGCVYASSNELSARWNWSRGKVLRFLEELERTGRIVQVKSSVNTCITICDYGEYQCDDTSGNNMAVQDTVQVAVQVKKSVNVCKSTHNGIDVKMHSTSGGTSDDTSEQGKKEEKKKETKKNKNKESNLFPPNKYPPKTYETYELSFVEETLKEPFFEWLQYKKDRKDKKYTERGIKMAYKRLYELSGGDADIARMIVEQSESNNWAGMFALKENSNGNRNNTAGEQRQHDRMAKLASILTD